MAGSEAEDEVQHSPRTRGIISHFERQVRLHTDVLDEEVHVTNERLGHLEMSQIATNTKITRMEASLGAITTSLTAILQRLEESDAGCQQVHMGAALQAIMHMTMQQTPKMGKQGMLDHVDRCLATDMAMELDHHDVRYVTMMIRLDLLNSKCHHLLENMILIHTSLGN